MKKIKTSIIVLACFILTGCSNSDQASHTVSLKEALKDKFLIGAAINTGQASEKDVAGAAVVKQQFSSVTAENCMKSMYIQPSEGQFFFGDADRFVKFGVDNNMSIIGHTLVWHSQAPGWFFTDESGNDVSREVLIERMRAHITALVTRYKGKIKGWDVLNEAIEDDGSFRQSKFYRIIGEEYIRLAFQFANEADPGAELYYNDYSMAHEGKRQGVVNMVKSLQENGIRIDGIGMQGHFQMDFPSVTEFEKSLLAFAGLGVKVMITELDLTILPGPKQNVGAEISATFEYQKEINPYTEHIPEDVQKAWDARYLDFFRLFLKHHDKIDRVTLWGVGDGNSWKNDWPVKGRTDYPLLFDRDYQPKPIVAEIIKEIKN